MTETIDIKKIHPELEPISGAPSLFSFYGCGLRLVGNRDYSAESQSSVKTQYLSLFYIPIIPLKSYRVAKDGQQMYFLGKVPVSGTARKASMATVAAGALAIGGLGTQQYLASEGHRFGETLANAETAMDEGRYAEAMTLYKDIHDNSDSLRFDASFAMGEIMDPARLGSTSNAEMAGVLSTYNSFGASPLREEPEGVYELALDRVKSNDGSDHVGVHKLLHAAQGLNAEGEDLSVIDAELVKVINENDPTNLEAAIETSEPFYLTGDFSAVKRVLSPVKDKLGDSEGARILGQTYIAEGNNAEAYPLLTMYTSSRLKTFQEAETRFTDIQNTLWDKEFEKLSNGLGPDSFYKEYENAPENEQQTLVDAYISERVTNKPKYVSALNLYRQASEIVPVVMDYGILQLRRAEGLSSQTEREDELQAAEETFLSIKNIAGDSDEYKIYLGQVYFWLGKQDEGQVLFDEILDANGRAPQVLLSIAGTLRGLGKVGLAENLAKEAYETSNDQQAKYEAANVIALLSNSIEDRINWLEKSDPKAPYIQASLKETKGQLAAQKGDTRAAIRYYKEAIVHSEGLPENSTTFNNTALIYFSLHRVTGDKSTFKKGADLMLQAVSLQSDDSILLSNAADTLLTSSLYDILPDTIQYGNLNSRPALSALSSHYNNEAEKEGFRQSLLKNKDFQTAVDYLQRGTLLAPNNSQNYTELSRIYYLLEDNAAIAKMATQMEGNQIDISANQAAFQEYVVGTTATEDLVKLKERDVYLKELLKKKGVNDATKGALYNSLSENALSLVVFGETSSLQDAIKHAKNAVKLLPSSNSRDNLSTALIVQASLEAAQKFPTYKETRDAMVKRFGDAYLVGLAVRKDDELAAWLKSNTAFKQVVAIESQDVAAFPKASGLYSWAILDAVNDPAAQTLKANIESSNMRASMLKVNGTLRPYSGGTVASQYWMNQLSGKRGMTSIDVEALEVMGLGIPTDLFE